MTDVVRAAGAASKSSIYAAPESTMKTCGPSARLHCLNVCPFGPITARIWHHSSRPLVSHI